MSNVSTWLDELSDLNPDMVEYKTAEIPAKTYAVDIATLLNALDIRNKYFFRKLTEEQQKSIAMFIIMRWMTSSYDNSQQPDLLLDINAFVNRNFSVFTPKKSLGNMGHAELQWMLLSLCGTGKKTFRKLINPGRNVIKNKLEVALLKLNPLMKLDEIELLQKVNTEKELKAYFKDNAFIEEDIKEIFKKNAK